MFELIVSFTDMDYIDELSLTESYCSRHFLVGLIQQETVSALREPRDYRRRAIALLRNLLAKHASDRRYTDTVSQMFLIE